MGYVGLSFLYTQARVMLGRCYSKQSISIAVIGIQVLKVMYCGINLSRVKPNYFYNRRRKQNFVKSNIPFWFGYISVPIYCSDMFLYSRLSYGSHCPNELCTSLLACLKPEKQIHQSNFQKSVFKGACPSRNRTCEWGRQSVNQSVSHKKVWNSTTCMK